MMLDRAAALEPNNPDVALAKGEASAALGHTAEAAAAYGVATKLQPSNPAAWYGLATAALGQIETHGSRLARTHGDSAWAGALYADELLMQGRLTEATKIYKQVAAKADAQQRCELSRVLTFSEQHELASLPEETRSGLQQTLQADPAACRCEVAVVSTSSAFCAYLGGYYVKNVPSSAVNQTPADPETLYWSIKSNERQAVLALSHFEEFSPQSPATFDLTGDLYRRRAMPDHAQAEYARALALDPNDPAALLGTAAAYLTEHHPDEALTFVRRGLATRPQDPKRSLAAAEALVDQHQFDQAKPYLETSLHGGSAESTAFAHALLGRVAAAQGDTPTAIYELRLGLSTDSDGSLHFQLARLLRKTGDLAGANAAEAQSRVLVNGRLSHAATAIQNAQEQSATDPLPN